jgi:aldose 1-epimerase
VGKEVAATVITLSRGETTLDLAPDIGGAVTGLRWKGRNVLRPASADLRDPLDASSFTLVPYANRIRNGTFTFEGRDHSLPRNFGDHPHPLHGDGWRSAWRVGASGANWISLKFLHLPDAWPWAYSAAQLFAVGEDSLSVKIEIRNEDKSSMPFSLGFHPYFPRGANTHLMASLSGVWLSDQDGIPVAPAEADVFLDFAAGCSLARAPVIDHCYTNWDGIATIEQSDMAVTLTADPALSFLHLYVPEGRDFFCAEPVSAMPDSFNRGNDGGMRVLLPGESFAVSMKISMRCPT